MIIKTLLVTMDFPPLTGGIANYYFNLVNKMQSNELVVLMNDLNNKTEQPFKIYYKKFFTKLIWPHWIPLIFQINKIVKKEKIQKIWVGQILPVGTAVWILTKFLRIPRDPSTSLRSARDDGGMWRGSWPRCSPTEGRASRCSW